MNNRYRTKVIYEDNMAVYNKTPILALENALKNYPAIASSPNIMQLRCKAPKDDEIHIGAYRANTEAIVGKIANQQLIMILHGGGFLHTADKLSNAISNQISNCSAAPIDKEQYEMLIAGKLPDGNPLAKYNLHELLYLTVREKIIEEPHLIVLYKDQIGKTNSQNTIYYNKRELEDLRIEMRILSQSPTQSNMRNVLNSKAGIFIAMCGGTSYTEQYITYLLNHKNNFDNRDQRFVFNHPFTPKYTQDYQQPHVRATFVQPPTLGFDISSSLERNSPYVALTKISESSIEQLDETTILTMQTTQEKTEENIIHIPIPAALLPILETYLTQDISEKVINRCNEYGRMPTAIEAAKIISELVPKDRQLIVHGAIKTLIHYQGR